MEQKPIEFRVSGFGYPLSSLVAWWWRRRKPEHACSNIPRLDAGPGSASIDKPAHFFSGIAPEPLAFILSLGNRCLCCLPAQSPLPVCCRSWVFFILALPCLHFFFTVRRGCWNSLLHFVQASWAEKRTIVSSANRQLFAEIETEWWRCGTNY